MDLKLRDVAELLNVSETTVRRWVDNDRIPYYRLNQETRFSRQEIENWVLSAKEDGFTDEESLGTQHFGLYRAIHKGSVYKDIPGDTKEEVIRNAVDLIAADINLDAEVITELLLDREKLMPTALSNGVAVPHTRDFLIPESFDVVAVVFPKKPIEFGALDNQKVDVLFFLFACDDKRHLHLLAKLAHLSRNAENIAYLHSHPSKQNLLEYVKDWEGSLNKGLTNKI
ncbi:MAG TPA: PTS sugar transporter subunit IIA [Chlamydiales bacterium]|nr:PTS sugar transporter subunit IIA [Chlamydiales bacterium]